MVKKSLISTDEIKQPIRIVVTSSGNIPLSSKVITTAKTGIEMEALTAVAVALLTVYDMCKAVDSQMRIGEIALLSKSKVDVD